MTREEASAREWCKQNGYVMMPESVYEQDITKAYFEGQNAEPCEDAISRQAAQDYIAEYLSQYLYNDVRAAVEVIDEYIGELPSVTPKQKMGHWEMCEDANGIYGVCDMCGTDADFSHYGKAYPYCPNCGAKMEVEE